MKRKEHVYFHLGVILSEEFMQPLELSANWPWQPAYRPTAYPISCAVAPVSAPTLRSALVCFLEMSRNFGRTCNVILNSAKRARSTITRRSRSTSGLGCVVFQVVHRVDSH
jgi:hypothetical protein